MSYNAPGDWFSSPSQSPIPDPASLPKTAAEVYEHLKSVEAATRRAWEDYPNPEILREKHHQLTTNLRRTLVQNVDTAEYAGMPTSQRTFTCFARLPPEPRRRIWRFALPGPRIIELQMRKLSNEKGASRWQYLPKNPHPLWQTCKESYGIARSDYRIDKHQNKLNKVPSTPWIKYDQDIVHLRDVDFGLVVKGYAYPDEKRARYTYGDTHSFEGRPDCFNHIEALAVSYDLLFRSEHRTAYLLRHFFPKLRVLVLLIDDAFEIDEIWPDDEGVEYEQRRRDGFVANCTGPFGEVEINDDYASEIQSEVHSKLEEESELCLRYYVPDVLVRAAILKPGNSQLDIGRYPEGYDPDNPCRSEDESVFSKASSIPGSVQQLDRNPSVSSDASSVPGSIRQLDRDPSICSDASSVPRPNQPMDSHTSSPSRLAQDFEKDVHAVNSHLIRKVSDAIRLPSTTEDVRNISGPSQLAQDFQADVREVKARLTKMVETVRSPNASDVLLPSVEYMEPSNSHGMNSTALKQSPADEMGGTTPQVSPAQVPSQAPPLQQDTKLLEQQERRGSKNARRRARKKLEK